MTNSHKYNITKAVLDAQGSELVLEMESDGQKVYKEGGRKTRLGVSGEKKRSENGRIVKYLSY